MMSPRIRSLWQFASAALVATLMLMAPLPASAASAAVTVTSVNMRAGPSTGYPVVAALPSSAPLKVYGCNADTSWCDVGWSGSRGWVASNYVQVIYRGSPVVVTAAVAPAVNINVVSFNQSYWNRHYVGRPWHGDYDRYHNGHGDRVDRNTRGNCSGDRCSGAAVSRGPNGGKRAAAGTCHDGVCKGGSVTKGPAGNVRVRHGSTGRRD